MLREMIFHWVSQHGYIGIFSLLMLGIIGAPIPDEILLTSAGYLVYKGDLHLVQIIASAFFGSACGITLSYVLGRTLGIYLIHKFGHIVHLTADKVAYVHNWFEKLGKWTLLFGYFVPGVRHLTAYVAGITKLEMPVFALFAYTGGFLWSVSFILIGYFLGEQWAHVSEHMQHGFVIGSGIVVLSLMVYLTLSRGTKTAR